MRRRLPHLLALVLGVGAALLAACGSGTKSGIPAASAGQLKNEIEDVRQAADDGRCSDVPGQLKQVDQRIDGLPPSTDSQLVGALRSGADKLRQTAIEECDATPTTETTETTETVPQTSETDTTTDTTELPPVETTTEPQVTVPPPPPPATTPQAPPPPPVVSPIPPEPLPPPSPAAPSGGARPEIPPG